MAETPGDKRNEVASKVKVETWTEPPKVEKCETEEKEKKDFHLVKRKGDSERDDSHIIPKPESCFPFKCKEQAKRKDKQTAIYAWYGGGANRHYHSVQ